MILLLLAVLILALVKFWYVTLGALAVYLGWVMLARWREAQAHEDRDRLRHARARREIDAIGAATAQAMVEAARKGLS
jgi:hypothetical protein